MTNNLIEALEKAEGPSRELDAEIFVTQLTREKKSDIKAYEPIKSHFSYLSNSTGKWMLFDEPIPTYTESIDAALTLVPDGCLMSVDNIDARGGENKAFAEIYRPYPKEGRGNRRLRGEYIAACSAKTMPLALCLAALRAMGDDDGS